MGRKSAPAIRLPERGGPSSPSARTIRRGRYRYRPSIACLISPNRQPVRASSRMALVRTGASLPSFSRLLKASPTRASSFSLKNRSLLFSGYRLIWRHGCAPSGRSSQASAKLNIFDKIERTRLACLGVSLNLPCRAMNSDRETAMACCLPRIGRICVSIKRVTSIAVLGALWSITCSSKQ